MIPEMPAIPALVSSLDKIHFAIIVFVLIVKPLFVGHVVELGFVAGVGAKRALILGDDGFALADEGLAERMLVPVERRRVAVAHYVQRTAVDVEAAPFPVEQIEVKLALVNERKAIPSLH